MIRINLLPFRTARKKENVRRQISYAFLSLILVAAVLTLYNMRLGNTITRLNAKIETTRKQVEKYQKDADQVDIIRKKLATLRKKTQVINNLENNRQWPVRLLDTMTQVVVPKRMWFTLLDIKNNGVRIHGIALDNKTVADFMTRLEKTGMFGSVELKKLERKVISNSNLKQFQIYCRLNAPQVTIASASGKAAQAGK
jgi:type IV pilus assembly protein PilN